MDKKLTNRSFLVILIAFCIALIAGNIEAQGIKGRVMNEQGESLPFASIFIMDSNQGVASNIEGQYSLNLSPGRYRIKIQYLGYRQLDTTLQVGNAILVFNPVMKSEIVELAEATVQDKKEDPAYTIMRRAIAKAKYHAMQVDEYNAMVYVKGSGRLVKVPGLFKKKITKALAEEGIDSTVAFTQESVSKLHFIRPDQYRDTVISIRTSGDDNNTSPMGFIYSSFYEPQVVNAISPLAPDAFNHYRYEYLGFIEAGENVINKIKVIPKGKGDQVFEGVIYIVDDVWSIHSLDLTTYIWGIRFDMQQQFNPVLPNVWLPVHEIYDVSGSFFGFGFEYRYFAKLNDYVIKLNPDLDIPIVVLDDKIDKTEIASAEASDKEGFKNKDLSGLDPGEELSAKKLRKMLKEYEKAEIEVLPETDTITLSSSSTKQVIDSTAYKRDSSYWDVVRPMPLTDYEVRGYARQDSIAAIPPAPGDDDNDDGSQDTVSFMMNQEGFSATVKKRDKFSLHHLITGGRYDLNDHTFLELKGPLQSINYNTVDGFNGGYEFEFGNKANKKVNWEAGPSIRYNVARESFNYDAKLRFFGKGWDVQFLGGKQPRQFNYDFPLSPWANTAYTLFANLNYLKEYEQSFFKVEYSQKISGGYGVNLSGEYADRKRLENHTDIIFIDDKDLLFTSNDPGFIVDLPFALEDHKALITDFSIWFKPFWEYTVSNGTKRKDYSNSPALTLRYRKGWGQKNHPFDFISANFKYKLPIGAGSLLTMNMNSGKFIGDNKPVYFHDLAHFPGNRLIGTPIDPVSSFRMLDYYLYSTNDEYAYGLFNYQFRRFALTQFEFFRKEGIRENIILNTLITPQSQQYAEIGYAVNYVFRFMRIEFVTSWQDYKYKDFAVRFGIATDFQSIFGF
jgi:hypothetical protein